MRTTSFVFFVAYFIICFPFFTVAQTSFQDNFSDGDFSNNPVWSGDVSKYIVSGANNELQLNDLGVTGNASLSVPASIRDSASWEFLVRTALTTTGPSSSNRIRIYLQSNTSDFTSSTLNGYFLQIGETGSLDALDLYKVTNGTATRILRGTDGTVSGPAINSRIKISRNNSGQWTLSADHSGGNNFVNEGSVVDNTHNSGNYFGVYTTYSTTQGDKFYYDDFSISPLFVDVFPPNIISATAITSTQVDVLFDEAVNPASANVAGNYSINNAVSVLNATVDNINPALVHLDVATLVNLTNYQINVVDVEDLLGNAIINANANFSYLLIGSANFQDLIFNEIMIDPNPVINLPDAEFIELYNRSSNVIDLNGYKLSHVSTSSGTITTRTLGSYIIAPNQYVLLHNVTDYEAIPNDLRVTSFPALNNTSAYLILRDSSNNVVDSILYSIDWYQDPVKENGGWSLELINPNLVCKSGQNWTASNSNDGGTPGFANSVLDNSIDTIAPNIVSARQSSVNQAILTFDDVLDPSTALNISNYSVNNGPTVVFIQLLNERTVELTFNINLINNTTYTITCNSIEDCIGNSAIRTTQFLYLETQVAVHYDIIINEILPDATPVVGLPEKEFVELFNRSNKNINLEGFVFSDGTSSSNAVFPFYIIKPQEYLIIYKSGGPSYATFGNYIDFSNFPDLNVSGDELTLLNRFGNVIDAVSYEDSWYENSTKAEGGWTLERINPSSPCEGRENWAASVAQPPVYTTIGGTPGQANSVLHNINDLKAPSILRAFPFATSNTNNADSIRIFFSEAMGDSSSVLLSNYTIDNGITVQNAYLEAPFYNTIVLISNQALQTGITYTLTISSNLTDCIGNPIGLSNTISFAKPEPISLGDIIINEILFNPKTAGSDYLELYNKSSKILNLGDLWISNLDSSLINQSNRVNIDYLLFPNQYAVLTADPIFNELNYRNDNPDKTPDINKILKFDLPSMPDDIGTIILYTINNQQVVFIDSLSYSEDYHSPLIDDLNGVSLERIDFNAPTEDKNNWHSAAQALKFGSPTYQNSSAYSNEITDDGVVQLPDNTFSPDGDGYEDFLLINYNIDDIGFIGNLSVYDAHGRFVKQLLKNDLLMREGTVQWDGSTEAGTKALIGPYILFFEIFNPSGKVKRYKKTCVLAGKL